ncbi:DUF2818 family protein [Pusillimonas sp. 7-48]|uniref:DUF2818 family protein n=2 Tax=Pusillimonas minor TaxID=2697024 RepID=A0A842HJ80_9BURK|nr:DUF2818 family protein [Pusillimonas minor]
MDQTLAIVLLILLSLVTANLPFATHKPLLVLPWAAPGGRFAQGPMRWFESLLFFVVLAGLGAGTLWWVGQGLMSPIGMLLRVAILLVLVVALMAYPSVVARRSASEMASTPAAGKSFFDRLVEVLVFYALVGVLAFAFEASMGNVFVQGWEFYAITLSLFLVMAYPGYVYRYLMRHRPGKTS